MPEIINGIKLPRLPVEPAPEHDQENSRESSQSERRGFMRASPNGKYQIPERQSRKRKRHPWKYRKKPGLRRAKVVHAIDVGLQIPRQPARPVRGPERRRGQRNQRGCANRGGDASQSRHGASGRMVRRLHIGHAWRREPAYDSDQDNGDADDVKNVDSQQISPWRVGAAEKKFLHAKEQREGKNLCAAHHCTPRECGGAGVLAHQFVGNDCERNTHQK